jgi:hypothetical protein
MDSQFYIIEGRIDINVKDALKNWFFHGFHPGSFTMALITNDYKNVVFCAHALLTNLRDYLWYTHTILPEQAKSTDWKGYNNLSDKEKEKVTIPNIWNLENLLNII